MTHVSSAVPTAPPGSAVPAAANSPSIRSTPQRSIPELDAEGNYRAWGRLSYTIIGVYLFFFVAVVLVIVPRESSTYSWVAYLLGGIIALLLLRYVTTGYTINDTHLRAWRLLGGSRMPLDEVRRIEFSALRDLAPSAAMAGSGGWGWHGRMWSPIVGNFDSIFTDPGQGILVTGGERPLYISPRDPSAFARELSRRVRSYTGPLEVDAGRQPA